MAMNADRIVALAVALLAAWAAQAGRVTSDFNGGWEFSRDGAEWRAVDALFVSYYSA